MTEYWLMHWGPSLLPPAVRTVWGWKIVAAYFFAGTGSMAMFLAAYEDWRRRASALSRVGMISGVVSIGVALVLFVADLGVPFRVFNLIIGWTSRLTSSPMSWGALALTILPLLGLYSVLRGKTGGGGNRVVAPWVMLFGVLAAVYPGFLLSATSIALWNSYLPLFFLATSLSAGSAFMALVAALVITEPEERQSSIQRMETTSVVSTVAEIVFLGMLLYAAAADGRALPALRALIGSPVGLYFWIGAALTVAAGVGLLLPMVGGNRQHAAGSGGLGGAFVAAAGGSFLLRFSLFLAGFAAYSAVSPFGSYTLQLP